MVGLALCLGTLGPQSWAVCRAAVQQASLAQDLRLNPVFQDGQRGPKVATGRWAAIYLGMYESLTIDIYIQPFTPNSWVNMKTPPGALGANNLSSCANDHALQEEVA